MLAHEDFIRVALPLPPVQCCLQTVKAPIRKEFGQSVLSNIELGKGGVRGPTTYDTDYRYITIANVTEVTRSRVPKPLLTLHSYGTAYKPEK